MRRLTLAFALLFAVLVSAGTAFAAPPAADAEAPTEAQPALATGVDAGSCATEDVLASELGLDGAPAPALGDQDPIAQSHCTFIRYECKTCSFGVQGCDLYKCTVGPDQWYEWRCGSCGPFC